METPLLFISGAGLPAWIWDSVRERMKPPSVVAPHPGSGSVTDYAQAALEASPGQDVTVVAHSAGGVVASELTRLAPERIAGVLGVAAVIPTAGGSFVSSTPFPNRLLLPLVLRVAGTRPPDSAIRSGLGSGLDDATIERLIADFEPEPLSYFTSRTDSNTLRTQPRKGYIVTTEDRELPPAAQRRYADRLGPAFRSEVPAGHLPMLSHPAAVAAAIEEFNGSASWIRQEGPLPE
ncbi:alpha/beta fold hydrolase [Sinomonas mesophila]|uniref:alpha/beta fold hydrolase n=1 Tax=Sinomonas mesophila TaxID=1531955 RepID=UPI0009860095|nr:alpha/beta hydrolase [Sinomonas mesophila]